MNEKSKPDSFVGFNGQQIAHDDKRLKDLNPRFQAAWELDEAADVIAVDPGKKADILRDLISAHAETLLDKGILVNGISFRCDDSAITRLSALLSRAKKKEAADISFQQKFRTKSGGVMVITSSLQLIAIHDAVTDYSGDVLGASATLQDAPTENYEASSEWPQVPNISLQF